MRHPGLARPGSRIIRSGARPRRPPRSSSVGRGRAERCLLRPSVRSHPGDAPDRDRPITIGRRATDRRAGAIARGGTLGNVSVSKGLLATLGALAGGSLLAVAYLLGRVSASAPAPQAQVATPAAASPAASVEPIPTAPPFVPFDPPSAGPAPPASRPAQAEPVPPAPAPAAPTAAPADPLRGAVAAYLAAVDDLQPGKRGVDAQSMGNEMAAALAKGDLSGLDELIRDTESARQRLSALSPPAPCLPFHRESLASLSDALEMLRTLKKAVSSGDPVAQLAEVSSKATSLQGRSEALRKAEQELRERYGLSR